MRKEVKKKLIKTSAILQIFLMFSLTFAVAVLMSENVSAETPLVGGGSFTEPTKKGFMNLGSGSSSALKLSGIKISGSNTYVDTSGNIFKANSHTLGGTVENPTIKYQGEWKDPTGKIIETSTTPEYSFSQAREFGLGTPTQAQLNGYKEYNPMGLFDSGIKNAFVGHLAKGLVWSLTVVSVIQLIGGIAGLDKEVINSLTYASIGGIMGGQALTGAIQQGYVGSGGKLLGMSSGTAGLVIGGALAIAIFAFTYKKTETKTVNFQCLPWEPQTGGSKCEECNGDTFRPCTEYRCKSLGQACELLNANTPNAQCAWVSRNDVESPKITLSNAALYPEGLKYEPDTEIRPPAIGTKVKPTSATCLPAFTPLEFGFTTNEPAQCKIDYTHTGTFEDMNYYVGDDNYFSYNHTQKMRLPGPKNDTSNPLYIRNDGTMGLYVRCQDANGNENVDEYVFTFCVDAGPDTTPPVMEEFSLPSGSFVTYNADNVPIELYVNEPATCKWSTQSKNYDDMENTMKCYNSPEQVNADLQYTCTTNVTGVENMQDNAYYFRCMDSAGNKNVNSKELILKGSQPLNIIKVLPNETVTGSTEYVSVDLEIETGDGAEEGKSICYFSETGTSNSYIQMFETDSFLHKQTLSLRNGDYKYFFRCIDYGGNSAENYTEFNVFVDRSAPMVTRAYKEDALKIVTDEDAMCTYSLSSCDFDTKDGLEMIYSNPDELNKLYAEWKPGQKYYIRCQDKYGNEPSPNYCSIVVSSIELAKDESVI